MSGIFGIWNLDGRPLDSLLLTKTGHRLSHRGCDAEEHWVNGSMGVGCRLFRVTPESLNERQPYAGVAGVVAVFDGRLDSRQDLIDALSASFHVDPTVGDVVLVSLAYRFFGSTRFTNYLNGDFALALFDTSERKLFLARDPMGVRPLFYYRNPSILLFGSEIKCLLAHPDVVPKPDYEDFSTFLVGNRDIKPGGTFFRDIRGVVPGHIVIASPQTLRSSPYWDFDISRQLTFKSEAACVEEFRHHFQNAVSRRMRSAYPIAVSLSGGVDSSSIFCTAEQLRKDNATACPAVQACTNVGKFGTSADEVRFVEEIERMYGIIAQRIPIGAADFLEEVEREAWLVESPLLDLRWGATQRFLSSIKNTGSRVVLTGHWGDQFLFERAYLVDLFSAMKWGTVWHDLNEFRQWNLDVSPRYFEREFLKNVLRFWIPEPLTGKSRAIRQKLFGRSKDDWYCNKILSHGYDARIHPTKQAPSNHAAAIYREARNGYYTHTLECANKVAGGHGLEMAYPFLDRDLISYLMAIPPHFFRSSGIPKGILRSAMAGTIPPSVRNRRDKADFTADLNEERQRQRKKIVQLLASNNQSIKKGWMSSHFVAHLSEVAKRESGDAYDSWAIRDWVGLEMWLRTFDQGERSGTAEIRLFN